MRNHGDDGLSPGGGGHVALATRAELDAAVAELAEAERLRVKAAVRLARVRARGDGEAACGMPVTQHLRWSVALRSGTVTSLGVLTDVAEDLPTLIAAMDAGAVTLDQAVAVAWAVKGARRDVRQQVDRALDDADGWQRLAPEVLEVEACRLVEQATPRRTEQERQAAGERQYLHTQATLDGQGLAFHGQAHGVDAAELDAALRAAADLPVADDPDRAPDEPTVRSRQRFDGLMRIVRDWSAGGTSADGSVRRGGTATILALVDERDGGSGELLTRTRRLAPRLTPGEVARLTDAGARRIEICVNAAGEPVAIRGRAGHAIDDPAGLSEDAVRILCTVRDAHCRMPGCDRPPDDLHHLVWRAAARAGGETAPDDPRHRAWLCRRCHHRVVHRWRWTGTVGTVGRITWTRTPRDGPPVTVSSPGRLDVRLRPPPPPADSGLPF